MTQTISQTITLTSNTSVILIDSSTIPANGDVVVLIPSITLPGRIVNVRDTAGLLSPTKRIILSTMYGVKLLDTAFPSSVILNQPFAFVTAANRDPTLWAIQNTFAFPAELSVANLQGVNSDYLTTNTILANFISTGILTISTTNTNNLYSKTVSTNYLAVTNDVKINGGMYVLSSFISSLTVSSIKGDGAGLFNLAAISSLDLQSTVIGLSNIYIKIGTETSYVIQGDFNTAMSQVSTVFLNAESTITSTIFANTAYFSSLNVSTSYFSSLFGDSGTFSTLNVSSLYVNTQQIPNFIADVANISSIFTSTAQISSLYTTNSWFSSIIADVGVFSSFFVNKANFSSLTASTSVISSLFTNFTTISSLTVSTSQTEFTSSMRFVGSSISLNSNGAFYTLDVNGTGRFTSNLRLTTAGSFLSNAGSLSNGDTAAFFSNIFMSNAGSFLSNAGTLSNAKLATLYGGLSVIGTSGLSSNVTISNAGSYLSNTGSLSNGGPATFFSNITMSNTGSFLSNAGTLSNSQIATFYSNVILNTTTSYLSNAGSNLFAGQVGISNAPAAGFALDVNGPSRAAIFYSSCTVAGNAITLSAGSLGCYHDIRTTPSVLTINLPNIPAVATSNVGKYWTLRNNTGSDLQFTLTLNGATGITTPVMMYSNTSITIVVVTPGTATVFALF